MFGLYWIAYWIIVPIDEPYPTWVIWILVSPLTLDKSTYKFWRVFLFIKGIVSSSSSSSLEVGVRINLDWTILFFLDGGCGGFRSISTFLFIVSPITMPVGCFCWVDKAFTPWTSVSIALPLPFSLACTSNKSSSIFCYGIIFVAYKASQYRSKSNSPNGVTSGFSFLV